MASSSISLSITTPHNVIETQYPAFAYSDAIVAALRPHRNPLLVSRPQSSDDEITSIQLIKRGCPRASDIDCGNGFCCNDGDRCISDGASGSVCVPNYSVLLDGQTRPFRPVTTAFAAASGPDSAAPSTNGVFTSSGTETAPTNSLSSASGYHTTYTTVTVTASPTGAAASSTHHGLSGGAIAGIVIGVLFGLLILPCLLLCCCLQHRRNKKKQKQEGARGMGGFGRNDGAQDDHIGTRSTASGGPSRGMSPELMWPEPRRRASAERRDTDEADVGEWTSSPERMAKAADVRD